ncbi:uncharacterized protein LOC127569139 [Pristis pectinata]|uniref:uncharacterized protein LOC127569139 n=1 Tax=Pristis pectinata TaxID=685728 RepID=UPI00223E2960|nr:uncharacterized protein LOC127569139 [Pristis pectinata]
MAYPPRLCFTVISSIFLVCGPELISGQIRYSIPEEMEQGAFVGNIAQDLGLNVRKLSARTFRLSSDDGGRYMAVNVDNGLLSIRERIDRERICGQEGMCTIPLEIILENPFEVHRGEVEILDVNDNTPTFRDSSIVLQISEAIPPGVRFRLESAEDPDIGINTVAAYALSMSEYFSLKTRRTEEGIIIAELLLEKSLDRELQSSFQLVLTATDGGIPQRSGTAQILITVLDFNDNPPAFEHDVYRGSINENAPKGTLVMNVKANDLDEGLNAELTYSFSDLTSQRIRGVLSLVPDSGEILVEGPLDFEEANSYALDVQAVDHGSPAITGHCKVLIKVIDVNDNAPEIKVTSVANKIPENAPPGTYITLINVIDRDSGENGQVRCEVPKNVPFRLQTSSKHIRLITSGTLDREVVSEYNITISAWDLGSPSLSTKKTIQIAITDVNDNAPRFAEPFYNIYVTENNAPGASVFTVTASDPDLDQNSYVSYSFVDNHIQNMPVYAYFSINSMNGTIYALRSFDYEELKTFQIHVQACDAGVPPLSSSATIKVIILDQNDNAPVIVSPSTQSGSAAVEIVPQSAGQGYLVTKVMAADADSGQNARLFYQMVKSTNPSLFTIGQHSGEIRTVRNIVESDLTTQTLVILVKDNGQPSLSSTVTILVTVLQNSTERVTESSSLVENPEYFSDLNLYLIIIFSCTSIIFLLIIVLLIGIKCKQGRNITQEYDSASYCYKRGDSHDTFNRRPAMEETLRYPGTGRVVHVPDMHQYSVCLSPESAKSDFLFLKPCGAPTSQAQFLVKGTRPEAIEYGTMAYPPRIVFIVMAFMFLVCAPDLISGQIRYSIPEEMEQGAFVGNIAQDLGLNARRLSARKFRLNSDDGGRYMAVNADTGLLSIRERIDRERICGQAGMCTIPFEIIVENPLEVHGGEVEILDVNDNSPTFRNSNITLQMSEAIPPGVRFRLKSADDPDIGINTVAGYALSSSEYFSLKTRKTEDGIMIAELLLEKPLDRELQSSFQLVLTASDGGNPQTSGTTQILITVLDINDNPPVFEQEVYRGSLPENVPKGTLVMKVKANDLDEGLNAELTYSFSDPISLGRVQDLFSLCPDTGEIVVEGPLDFEEANSYSLDIQAVDRGSPAITGHTKVVLKVTDVNDNAPEIKVTSVANKIPENAPPGTFITLINIVDRDSGENGQMRCEVPKNVPFRLQTSSKHIRLITSGILDREVVSEYNISISAWDLGSPSLSTKKTIQIAITDVNDNAPRFAEPSYNIYVTENNAPGASVFTVTASDLDLDQNSYVSYSFVDNHIQNMPVYAYFSINSMNGTIYALRSFDYEELKTFQIHVEARDAGVPPLSSSATMNVIILDQNDNAPVIVSPSTRSGSAAVEIVPQSAGQGYLVTKILATDADSGQNARLFYRMLKSTNPSLFIIGQHSGEIRTARNILESDLTTQTLVILVKDNGQPSHSSTVTILVTVLQNSTERVTESSSLVENPEYFSDLNLYLIIIFSCTSIIFLLIIVLLIGIKCKQGRNITQEYDPASYCYKQGDSLDTFNRRPAMEETLRYPGTGRVVRVPDMHQYSLCLSPESAKCDFLFLKPCGAPTSQFCKLTECGTMAYPPSIAFIVVACMFLACAPDLISGQIRYSISEEMEQGAFVGNIAQDLRLNVQKLSGRKFRLSSDDGGRYMQVNVDNGLLSVCERIDRERICGQAGMCTLPFEITLENPLELHRGEVEILDINDNSPTFRESNIALQMSEAIPPGVRFRLKSAIDPDIGINTVSAYALSSSEYFSLRTRKTEDGIIIAELLLEKSLDRELQSSFQLVLTATDGGTPQRSGTALILITVLDFNDNPPVFEHDVYRGSLPENAPKGTLVMKVKANDFDEGLNAELTYSFSDLIYLGRVQDLFSLGHDTGEIRVEEPLDFEEANSYSLDIQAVDHGSPAITGHSKVVIKVTDVNDNAPEIKVTSVAYKIPENAPPGTFITLINIVDRDSGENGQVHCEVPKNVPFRLQTSSSYYKLITSETLDREAVSEYKIYVSAWDMGYPSLSTNKTIQIAITDVNDNAPRFAEPSYNIYVTENNAPGASIFAVTASDPDLDQNSYVSYSFMDNHLQNVTVSTYLSINSMNGTIYALRSFDYEELKNFQFHVKARDAGVPPLSSSTTVNVIILDQNDNAPVIVSPSAQSGSAAVEIVLQSVGQGYLVTKIMATDGDSGQNARLFYQMMKATDPSLFTVGQYSGEIRTARNFLESDPTAQTLVILVKDNGQPSLSSTVTIHITVLQNSTERVAESSNLVKNPEYFSDLNLYLIIIFSCTSIVFLVIIVLLIGIKCKHDRNISQEYDSASYCYKRGHSHGMFNRRPAMEETLSYPGTGRLVRVPDMHQYSVCLSPESAKSDFLFLKPCEAKFWKLIECGTMAYPPRIVFIVIACMFLACAPDLISGKIRYSLPEEMEQGAFVGNIAQDLGLNVRNLLAREFRLSSDDRGRYMQVNMDNGLLTIGERFDRERICGQAGMCTIPFEIILENPLEVHRGEVEILDINDNPPNFRVSNIALQISEAITAGVRFRLKNAEDPEVGINTVAGYSVSSSGYFRLITQRTEDSIINAELLLEKSLDRELQSSLQLVLTATDGGKPQRSGTVQILITVLDVNDNPPVFERDAYRGSLPENAPKGHCKVLIKVIDVNDNAPEIKVMSVTNKITEDAPPGTIIALIDIIDRDSGENGQNSYVSYSFMDNHSQNLPVSTYLSINSMNGTINALRSFDYEELKTFQIHVQARDAGVPPLSSSGTVNVIILDQNDNAPVIVSPSAQSGSAAVEIVPQSAGQGYLVTKIIATDADSG